LIFNGSNANEQVEMSANGSRFRLFRDVANITMDCDGIQNVVFNAVGGTDSVTIDDLTATEVTNVFVDLSASPGSGIGDGQPDTVTVNGSTNADNIIVTGNTNATVVTGLHALVTIAGAESNLDRLLINGLNGND